MKTLIIVFCLAVLYRPIAPAQAEMHTQAGSNVYLIVGENCGDGQVEAGEECDGSAGVPSGFYCDDNCQLQKTKATEETNAIVPPGIFETIFIYNIFVRLGVDKTVIDWSTNKQALCQLKWGDEQELKAGLSDEVEAKTEHSTLLDNLKADTDYYYQIFCSDSWGHQANSGLRQFRTKELIDLTAPANVSDFQAEAKDKEIILTWHNPKDDDFRAVKIRRSESFYPQSVGEGIEVYNDSGESFIDKNVIVGRRYYYTTFAYDNNANYSSGAVASAKIIITGQEQEEELLPLPPAPPAPKEELVEINLLDFSFFVANGTIEVEKNSTGFVFLPGTILNVRTKQKNYPKVLKSIILTLAPKDQLVRNKEAKSYLLRIDNRKDNYSTTFTMPVMTEDYDFQVVLLNFKNSKIAKTQDQFKIENFGRVTSLNNPSLSLIKTAQAAEPSDPKVYAAEITLLNYENGKFTKWRGEKYSQFNPMLSNQAGQYGFLVPNGLYMMVVKKENYYQYTSLPFKVTNNKVNQDAELVYYPRLNYKTYFLLPIILILLYLLLKRTIKKRKEKEEATV